jgi:hypothetical protein
MNLQLAVGKRQSGSTEKGKSTLEAKDHGPGL